MVRRMTATLTAGRALFIPQVLRDAGLQVVEVGGWQLRGVPFSVPRLAGHIGHHTASNANSGAMPTLPTLIHGRPDLAGPLAQTGLGRDARWYVVASGRANHAGTGQWPGIVLGNGDTLATEAENNGLGTETWSAAMVRSYAIGVAALLKAQGLPAERFCAHYEWATHPVGRKVDPRGNWQGGGDWWNGGHQPPMATWSAAQFRDRLRALLSEGDDDLTAEEHALLVQAAADAAKAKADSAAALAIVTEALGEHGSVRAKADANYVALYGADHRELVAGRVSAIDKTVNPSTAP